MYKHILVAVDGSDTSNLALQEAMRLAKEQKAALRLVHVVDETPAYMTMDIDICAARLSKGNARGGPKGVGDLCRDGPSSWKSKSIQNSSFLKS